MKKKLQKTFAALILLLMQNLVFGQAVNLGVTSSFALFTAAGAFNNLGASTTVTGDVGTNAGAFNAFPPGTLIGQKHVVDVVSIQAATDVLVAYMFLGGITCDSVIGTTLGSGQILPPKVYCLGAASTLNGDLILDGGGDPNASFIFKIDGALSTSTFSNVIVINGASLCNIYWQVNGAVSLGVSSVFKGTILANGAISLLQNATLIGRGLSTAGAISLQDNTVNVSLVPTAATISANGLTNFCAGDSVVLSGNIDGIWNTGAVTPSIVVKTNGDYYVTNATSCGSITSNHINITVNPLPIASIISASGAITFCAGDSVVLSGNASGTWSNGASTASITVYANGDFFVTNTNSCGSAISNHIIVNVNLLPTATTGSNASICNGNSITIGSSAIAGHNYFWTPSAGLSSVIQSNPIAHPSLTTTYTLTETITATGCKKTNSITISVNSLPTCLVTGNGIICNGQSTQLCAASGTDYSYKWSNAAITQCIQASTAGTFTVTVSQSGCSSSCSKTVIVNPAPSCLITGSNTICLGSISSLCVAAGYSNYLWSTGARTNCISISTAGTYSVTVTSSNGCTTNCNLNVTYSTSCTGSISGDVWFDINMNGIYDVWEKGINGLKVYVIDVMTGAIVATTSTRVKPGTASEDGYYFINSLKPGMYYLKFEILGSLVASKPYKGNNPNKDSDITNEFGTNTTKKFTIGIGQVISFVGAGFQIKSTAGDKVWLDINANGIQDDGESPVAGIKISAYGNDGALISQSISDSNGYYMLDSINEGDFYVKFDVPNKNYTFTQAHSGLEDVDSDVDGTYGFGTTKMYSILAGESKPTIDAGLVLSPLALDWLQFYGTYNGSFIALNWATVAEINNDHFVVERRNESDGTFTEIGIINADSSAVFLNHNYFYDDFTMSGSAIYYYRLKQVDKDGRYKYSKIIAVRVKDGNNEMNVLIYPNPVKDLLSIELWIPIDTELEVRIFDEKGITVLVAPINQMKSKVKYTELIDVSTLISGQYLLQVKTDSEVITKKFIKMQ